MQPINPRMGAEILVVDDDPAVCELVAIILRDAGYRPTTSSHVEEALALSAEGHRFSLAILDVVMPRMGGEGLAARLRHDDPDLKVLYLTGFADVLFQVRPILWENEAFLEKPFTDHGVLEAVSLLLSGHVRQPPSVGPDETNP
jgi:two-component system, cell cycle sensor histidine kinase and response regulator CckA